MRPKTLAVLKSGDQYKTLKDEETNGNSLDKMVTEGRLEVGLSKSQDTVKQTTER